MPPSPAPAARVLPTVPLRTATPNTRVSLFGTTHVWVVDDDGVLHWTGDAADWRASAQLDRASGPLETLLLERLRAYRIGEPWLSAALVRDGDAVYVARWLAEAPAPTLLHVQTPADLEIFGVTAANYGTFVLDRGTWEQRYGLPLDALPRLQLPGAAGAGPVPPMRLGDTVSAGGASLTPVGADFGERWLTLTLRVANRSDRLLQLQAPWSGPILRDNRGNSPLACGVRDELAPTPVPGELFLESGETRDLVWRVGYCEYQYPSTGSIAQSSVPFPIHVDYVELNVPYLRLRTDRLYELNDLRWRLVR